MRNYILSILFFILLLNISTVFSQFKSDGTFCYGKTAITCRSAGACCVWCTNTTSIPMSDPTSEDGSCVQVDPALWKVCPSSGILAQCPTASNYNTGSCTCDYRKSDSTKLISNFSIIFILIISTLL